MTPQLRLIERLRRAVIWLSLPLVLALVIGRIASGDTDTQVTEGPAQLVGLTVRYALPDGDYIQKTFLSDTKVHWKLLSGTHEGDEGTGAVVIRPVAPGIFFVNGVDPIGDRTVSEVFDLSTLTVSSFVTRPNPDDPLQRTDKFSKGRLEIVDTSGAA